MSDGPIRIERDGDVAVLIIDNPPINAGSREVRRGLVAAVAAIDRDPAIKAAVLIGAGGTFIAGSDIREFGKPLESPELPSLIAAIEASAKPFVAALEGAALGGGYELALGCDARIGTPDCVVGLPEVTLGMIPGAGGTQRLPRLVGAAKAIELICAGTRVRGDQAVLLGMIDEVAQGDLRGEAVALARRIAKARIADRPVPVEPASAIDAVAVAALKAGRGRPPVAAAIAAIRAAIDTPFAEALAAERKVFTHLRLGPEAAALRYLFFAERQAGRLPKGASPQRLDHMGVIGAGTMGAGIAAALLDAGIQVTLVDSNADALERGRLAIAAIFKGWCARGRIDEAQVDTATGRLALAGNLDALSQCDGAIEAIIEVDTAKTALLGRLAEILPPDAMIATNTSYLDVDALAAAVTHPERFLGLHFFNPAQTMRLIEVVRAQTTSAATLATGVALARRMGKQPVIAGPGPGFIGNRIYAAYRRTCEYLIEDGALPEQVDTALEAFGFAMGPFATGDLSGLDIAWAMRKSQAATRDPTHRYVGIADRLCEAGRLGRKTGAGWYAYPPGARRGQPDPAVHAIIEQESAAKHIVRRNFTPTQIVETVLATMVNEAALVMAAGIAERASDIDVVFTQGFGFPRHEGGPLYWAAGQPAAALAAAIGTVATMTGAGFRPGNIDAMLAELRKD